MRQGDAALHIGRHFSLRDALKWARRMQVRCLLPMHSTLAAQRRCIRSQCPSLRPGQNVHSGLWLNEALCHTLHKG